VGNRSRRRITAVAAASWLLATAVTSLVVWRAAAAFEDGTSTNILSSPQVVERLNAATATSTATPDVPTPTVATSSPSESSDETPAASTPTSAPTTTTRTTPRSTGSATIVNPTPSATPVVTTWTVTGGTVSVSCQAQVISLVYASPRDGWRVEIEKRGPDSVDVDLQRQGQGTKLNAICVNGIPQATTEANEGGD
jgi:hypothetical protein